MGSRFWVLGFGIWVRLGELKGELRDGSAQRRLRTADSVNQNPAPRTQNPKQNNDSY